MRASKRIVVTEALLAANQAAFLPQHPRAQV
jgi:hypothetical protein